MAVGKQAKRFYPALVTPRLAGHALSSLSVLVTLAAGSAFAAPAQPQDDEARLSEVVVTAERRETSLQKTPTTVHAISAEELERKRIHSINDLAGQAAGVTIATRTYTPAIFIRGVGSTRPIGNQSVGIYLDDVYIARPFGAGLYGALPDIERVEVLSGPQGTLYGKNTGGGAVKFVTRQPTDKAVGWASIGGGNKTNEARGYLAGALVPGVLNGSLAFAHDETYADTDNPVLGKKVNRAEGQQLRGILGFTPTEDFKATLSLDGLKAETPYALSAYRSANARKRTTYSDIDPAQDNDVYGGSLTLEKELDDHLRVKSITAVRNGQVSMPTDTDGKATYLNGFIQDLDMHQQSQEFQLFGEYDKINFVSGLIYFREDFDHERLSWSNNRFSIIDSSVQSTSYGVYSQLDYRPVDKLTLTAGLRYSREISEMDSAAYGSNVQGQRLTTTYSVNGLKDTDEKVHPKFAIAYQWTPDLLTYASYAWGSTAGGYNSAAASRAIALVPVEPDKITAYEVGLKNTAWNGRLRTSTTLFYNDYEDYQASVTNAVIDGQQVSGAVIVNAGKAHTWGFEFSSALKATQNLELAFNLAYLRTRFDEYLNPTGAANSNFVGYDLPNSPRWSGRLDATYRIPLKSGGDFDLGASLRYEDESYSSVSADREMTKSPAQTYVDLGGYYTTGDGRWTYSLTVKNLFDRDYALPGSYNATTGYDNVLYNRERQVSLGLKYQFL
ncbi:TonB-dependent receptor [Pseudomonas sp. LRF_L74]|uniref:TonB-dependent receptor n=1 Tax=Pseudomonas sp. LRF_L74 TaxID=3369422 RepID=UPI003F6032B3